MAFGDTVEDGELGVWQLVYIAFAVPSAWVVVLGFLFNEESRFVFLAAVRLVEAALILGNNKVLLARPPSTLVLEAG